MANRMQHVDVINHEKKPKSLDPDLQDRKKRKQTTSKVGHWKRKKGHIQTKNTQSFKNSPGVKCDDLKDVSSQEENLRQEISQVLSEKCIITENVINFAQKLLSDRFPQIEGFQAVRNVLSDSGAEAYRPTKKFIQLLWVHQDPEDEKGGHWVTASNINSDSSVDFDVYDSQKSVDDNDDYDNEDLYFLSKVIRCNNNELRVGFPVVQQQDENSSDCGLFALLNAFILGNNIDKPERVEVNDVRRLRRDVHAFLTTQNTLHLRESYHMYV